VDTGDHVVNENLVQGAQVTAAADWGFLNGERLPHHDPVKGKGRSLVVFDPVRSR
jgi:hypothetical protein